MTSALRLPLLTLALGFGLVGSPQPVAAEPFRPQPPPSVPLKFDPDVTTCTPTVISQAFAQHLKPWADQPPEVLNQLRRLQAEMTLASIDRCISLGHLTPEQAAALQQELSLTAPTGQPSRRP